MLVASVAVRIGWNEECTARKLSPGWGAAVCAASPTALPPPLAECVACAVRFEKMPRRRQQLPTALPPPPFAPAQVRSPYSTAAACPSQPRSRAPTCSASASSGSQPSKRTTPRAAAATTAAPPAAASAANMVAARTSQVQKHLCGREVEEAAMWEQIKLHESWAAGGHSGSGLQGWQGQELQQAYERCGSCLAPLLLCLPPTRQAAEITWGVGLLLSAVSDKERCLARLAISPAMSALPALCTLELSICM